MSPTARAWVDLAPLLGIGWVFVFSIGAFTALGWWLDRRFGTGGVLVAVAALVGVAVGFVNFFKVVLGLKAGKRR
jgi:hypothetical protein